MPPLRLQTKPPQLRSEKARAVPSEPAMKQLNGKQMAKMSTNMACSESEREGDR